MSIAGHITEITIRPHRSRSGYSSLLAWASVVIMGDLAIRDIRIIESRSGRRHLAFPYRDAMPGQPAANARGVVDIAFPVHAGAREAFESVVLAEFDRLYPHGVDVATGQARVLEESA